MPVLNRFTTELKKVVESNPLAEKWVVTPSLRVGQQWQEVLTRNGCPVLNLRLFTPTSLAMELARPAMAEKDLRLLKGHGTEFLAARVFDQLRALKPKNRNAEYLTRLDPSPGLSRSIARTLTDLRLAGQRGGTLPEKGFEDRRKQREIGEMLTNWEAGLVQMNAIDDADLYNLAAAAAHSFRPTDKQLFIIAKEFLESLPPLVRSLWSALPKENRQVLAGDLGEAAAKDLKMALQKMTGNVGADNIHLCRSVGEVNEVRQVLRTCLSDSIPFDEVEILHTDSETYVPLIFETLITLMPEEIGELPVTFAEGIPARYSRPGRALMAWMELMDSENKTAVFSRMVRDGLILLPENDRSESPGQEKTGQEIACCKPTSTLKELGSVLRRRLAARREAAKSAATEQHPENPVVLTRQQQALEAAITTLDRIIRTDKGRDGTALLSSAVLFLSDMARAITILDAYSSEQLIKEISEFASLLNNGSIPAGLDASVWLEELPTAVRVQGKSPGPGCMHVTNLTDGGHSGRKHTFVLGLDDRRFPGANLQDAMLLDRERKAVSTDLPSSADTMNRRLSAFNQLLARLRGTVYLSFSCCNLDDSREQFPAGALITICRILHDIPDAGLEDILERFQHPASFAPAPNDACITITEWWLQHLCGGEGVANLKALLKNGFPHLEQGMTAVDARASRLFTEYDGHVPEAAIDLTGEDLPLFSASRLEKLAGIPMEYFFRHILDIALPDEYSEKDEGWLNSMQKGSLTHDVLCRFLQELKKKGTPVPSYARDLKELLGMVDEELEQLQKEHPPPNQNTVEKVRALLHETMNIFLIAEEEAEQTFEPAYCEVTVGMKPNRNGTDIDCEEPAVLELANGRSIRLRGQIDRIDRSVHNRNAFTLWDYKTGSPASYKQNDPVSRGRHIQTIVYLVLADAALKAKHGPSAEADRFGYYFPGIKGKGKQMHWDAAMLREEGLRVLELLMQMLESGSFPASEDRDDYRFSDFADAFGRQVSESVQQKLEEKANQTRELLKPYAELLGKGVQDE